MSANNTSVLGPLRFFLLVNKQGQTRLSKYFVKGLTLQEKGALEGGLVRRCLSRSNTCCSFLQYENFKVVFRRYASLFLIVGVDDHPQINELLILEFIHSFVESLDKYFKSVCELDIMFNLEKAHFILEECVSNDGEILDCNRTAILDTLDKMDKLDQSVADDAERRALQSTSSQVTSAVGDMFGRVTNYLGGGHE
eukprot:GHVH01007786.1.p2 GENE.GHVH01007786.1~~GHVH01007786.1.p2  ORF type:complete len:196 (-),score=26.93 GHVH01007786.1:1308-1895(-)